MPRERRPDRLARDELLALQHKALREWKSSDWLAETDPRGYLAVEEHDPQVVCVELGGAAGDANQTPGYVVVGAHPPLESLFERISKPDGPPQRRGIDVYWDLSTGIPFEDQTVERYHVRSLPETGRGNLAAELARTLVSGGTVDGKVPPGMTAAGFEQDDTGAYVLTRQVTRLEDAAPLLIDDRVLGAPQIRQPRQPVPT